METNGPFTLIEDRGVTNVVFGPDTRQIIETNVVDVNTRLLEIVDQLPAPRLVLDMTKTDFFGSSFVEVLFRIWKKVSGKPETQLALVGLQKYCREVIVATRLDTFWQIYDTRQTACDAFNSATKSGK